ncbi:type II secretion system F family protein (plasmid) [Pseudomonas fulva]|jgi:type II secretory pathway component PulF|uniref:Secretion protein n=2 Tax=Pseudomonas putida group TaxID=136845 RepID=A0A1X0ZR35_PSEPU|nr:MULTISPECIES: type II secretion system F family protein [Pseudomonas]MCT8162754.1 type II secretion system F family protein [Pseudomonas sp. HD6422]MCT8181477.1 type II secretion system F family protein [Pseudomonas sp. HD6421]ORL52077.1 secretion protein [Pseudomonas putida]ORL62008.1 secretion protein [Pseudomonas putida]ORL65451.1 secretion protein [Pseudomonas putida]
MAYWLISYIGESGSIETSSSIKAESREQAIQLFGRPPAFIQQVKVDHLGVVKAAFEKKFPPIEQVLMLSAIASKLASGKTISKAIKESVDFGRLGLTFNEIDRCETPKEYFTKLRFDETAILIADAGDKAGRLSDSLYRAAKAIQERINAKKEFGKAMQQGLLYTLLGSLFMIGIPLWAGSTIHDFIEVQRIPLKLNSLSNLIMFLHMLYTQYFIFLIAGAAGIYLFREKIWDNIRTLPGFSFINERMKVSRGLDFVTSYQLLLSSGFNNLQSFRFLATRSKGLTHRLYVEASDRLNEGRQLSDVFDSPEWPPIVHQNLQGFEEQGPSGRDLVLTNLNEALRAYYLEYSARVSRAASIIGFAMMILTIMMFAVGFYMPIVNLNSALKQM